MKVATCSLSEFIERQAIGLPIKVDPEPYIALQQFLERKTMSDKNLGVSKPRPIILVPAPFSRVPPAPVPPAVAVPKVVNATAGNDLKARAEAALDKAKTTADTAALAAAELKALQEKNNPVSKPPAPPVHTPPVHKPEPEIELTHIRATSGGHSLLLQSPGNPNIYSPQVGYEGIAICVHPKTGVKYCATTEAFKGVLPEVFLVTEIPFKTQKSA